MLLPLLERAKEQSASFLVTPRIGAHSNGAPQCGTPLALETGIPQRALLPGEQYRFHFDMTKCIGCKCCVVACNEQNGNPADINWRRVGEIEGGWYPDTQRLHLSMGCNHCIEPTCLAGCPVDAYSKDPLTGVVLHSADICIGCQYCTWNCSYGVPQYNPERGVVGKCDMCHNRLAEGREPACVGACPETAIQIEIVNIADWKRNYAASANAPGLPSADDSISSTRLTLPENLPPNMQKADFNRVKPEQPHFPLVVMTVLTQLSVGDIHYDLAARTVRESHATEHRGDGFAAGWRFGIGRIHDAPRPSSARLSRFENVEAVLVEPRGPAVLVLFRSRWSLCRFAVGSDCPEAWCLRRAHVAPRFGWCHCKRVHLSGPSASSLEHQTHHRGVSSHGCFAWSASCREPWCR